MTTILRVSDARHTIHRVHTAVHGLLPSEHSRPEGRGRHGIRGQSGWRTVSLAAVLALAAARSLAPGLPGRNADIASAAHLTQPAQQAQLREATFTLDNVAVTVSTPFLPGQFYVSTPGDLTQAAGANATQPWQQFSVIA